MEDNNHKPSFKELSFKELIKESRKKDYLKDFGNYNNALTISQVIKFFEKHGGHSFTRTMIQNYSRIGVLPPLKDKRYYVKEHVMALALIDWLKSAFALDDIKKLFVLAESVDLKMDSLYYLFLNMCNADALSIIESTENLEQKQYAICTILQIMANSVSSRNLALLALEKSFI